MHYQKQFDRETKKLDGLIWYDTDEKKTWFQTIFLDIEPKILRKNGKINWFWVLWNIGKIVAKLVYALKIQSKLKNQ